MATICHFGVRWDLMDKNPFKESHCKKKKGTSPSRKCLISQVFLGWLMGLEPRWAGNCGDRRGAMPLILKESQFFHSPAFPLFFPGFFPRIIRPSAECRSGEKWCRAAPQEVLASLDKRQHNMAESLDLHPARFR